MQGEQRLEWVDIDEPKYFPANPKAHDIEGITASIDDHGFLDPPMVDERTGQIVEGNGRIEVLRAWRESGKAPPRGIRVEGSKWLAPLLRGLSFNTNAEAKRYLLRHNRSTERGGYVREDLAAFLKSIRDDQQPISDLGWSSADLSRLLHEPSGSVTESTNAIDRVEELTRKWKTGAGQRWLIASKATPGQHHVIICGDSKLVQGAELGDSRLPALGLHDPPYGVAAVENRGKGSGRGAAKRTTYRSIAGDGEPFDPRHLTGYPWPCIIWGANHFADKLKASSHWIVWDKRVTLEQNSFADCELAWTSLPGVARIYRHMWNGMIRSTEMGEERFHPTMKPIALFADIIQEHTNPGELVHDAYLGSGTTLLACERTGRLCFGVEIDPGYVAVCLERASTEGLSPSLDVLAG